MFAQSLPPSYSTPTIQPMYRTRVLNYLIISDSSIVPINRSTILYWQRLTMCYPLCRAFVDSVVFLVTPCEFPIFLNIGRMRQGRLLSDGGPRCHRNTHRIGGSRQWAKIEVPRRTAQWTQMKDYKHSHGDRPKYPSRSRSHRSHQCNHNVK